MLLQGGLKKGDRIAWIGKNSDLYFTLFYGRGTGGRLSWCQSVGGWRRRNGRFIVNDTQAKWLFYRCWI